MTSASRPPALVILAGPNGAGKSTVAQELLANTLGITEFINADVIAAGLSAFAPQNAAIAAGRIMLARAAELAERRTDFAIETTLATRGFVPWLKSLISNGYQFHLIFMWLPNPAAARARVEERVRTGGHNVPDHVVERRYHAGLNNFFELYRPLTSTWRLFDNSSTTAPRLIAAGTGNDVRIVLNESTWRSIESTYGIQEP